TTGTMSISPTFSINRQSPISKAALVVIDECSMVDEQLGRDLMGFGTPILVLGDPAQLPPISGGGFFTEHEPDHLLTEIHRQAQDRKSTRLNSSHVKISYAVFCLKKKKKHQRQQHKTPI